MIGLRETRQEIEVVVTRGTHQGSVQKGTHVASYQVREAKVGPVREAKVGPGLGG